ncbi:carboxymuconolactone decarboxylase family protein [Paucibacter sp. R3-3]|uniref:Carboxymuconolactone decarboxylase family protein n=1 Tax=Roseateles agri TaxID=3098619 RepID=A0ABU5DUC7_9BURK|nr:carboxymuconolactone decarboxylase family protein [Paucibacter sp. R3-3]MDY0749007.1 carboxymuconolactone decarboxylase family protein [Paucibacter sp. R3-3]
MTQRLDHQALAPDGMRALGGVYGYIMSKTGLDSALVDLVYLRASQINGCAYCISMHSKDLMKASVPAEKLLLLSAWREAGSVFSARERAALAWAESVTLVAHTSVPDDVFEAASETFTAKELVDLTLAVGVINTYNRMAISFRKQLEAPTT